MEILEGLLERAQEPEVDPPMSPEWISVLQAANRLNLHTSTVYRHLHAGTFPCESMRIGRTWRIWAADVDSLGTSLRRALAGDIDTSTTAAVLAAVLVKRDDQ